MKNEIEVIPVSDRLLVLPDKKEEKIGDLYIPDQGKVDSVFGTVKAVGPGKKDVSMQCKAGDRIMFSKYSGQRVVVNEVEYSVMREADVFCIIPKQKL